MSAYDVKTKKSGLTQRPQQQNLGKLDGAQNVAIVGATVTLEPQTTKWVDAKTTGGSADARPSAPDTSRSSSLGFEGKTALEQAADVGADALKGAESAHPPGDIGQCPFFGAVGRGDPAQLREVAMATMTDKVFGEGSLDKAEKVAITALQADPSDTQGKSNALLGLVAFRQEKYGDAVKFLEIAARRDPGSVEVKELLKRARTNLGNGIAAPLGPTAGFDKEQLLEAPALQLRMPDLGPAPEKKSLFERATDALQSTIAEVRTTLATAAAKKAIALAGKNKDPNVTFEFQSWDKKSAVRGELEIGALRNDLNQNRLKPTYDGEVGFQVPGQVKPEWTEEVRTATGAWTTNQPMEGAAGTELGASGTAPAERRNRALDPSLPSEREVSRVMLTATGPRTEVPFLNNLAIAWIQFENHDWVSHGANQSDGFYEVKLAPDDPIRVKYGLDVLRVPKTAENPLAQPDKLTHLNEVTHWWDGSQIYGSDQATQDRLRAGPDGKALPDGKLRIEGDLLPINGETGVEDSGMTRNWWVGLDMLHVLFVKEHNSIAEGLKREHPDWTGDRIFNVARLINAAEMAKIHTVEWTPAVLPNEKLVNSMATNWFGAEEVALHKVGDRKAVRSKLAPKDPILGGLVGGKTDNHGVPYSLSEEFTEVYRLHAALLERLQVRKVGSLEVSEEVELEATRAAGARDLIERLGNATVLNSFGNQHMAALVANNYPAWSQDTSVDGSPVADLGTLDILRARERGVPPYNEFRRKMGLPELKSFADLGVGPETVAKLEGLYGKGREGLEKMDLLVGTLSEAQRPDGFGFGETMFQVFVQMASRRLQADPFYTEKYDAEHYTQSGLDRIDQVTMKDLLLKHYPELRSSGLVNVKNAFEPWSSTAVTAPEEHPLDRLEKY